MVAVGGLHVGRDRSRIDVAGVDVHANAWLDHVDDDQADHQGQCRDDLEVDQRLDTDPADFLDVAHLGYADDDRTEDDRRQQHLDQFDEAVGERLKAGPDLRPEIAD